jgi:hypothetical protein
MQSSSWTVKIAGTKLRIVLAVLILDGVPELGDVNAIAAQHLYTLLNLQKEHN